MSNRTRNITGVLAASLVLLSASADAQGKSKENKEHKEHKVKNKVERVSDGNYERDRERDRERKSDRRDWDLNGNGVRDANERQEWDRNGNGIRDENERKIPPGLAKKPGQMPPGQYKKVRRYETSYGATTLSDILRSRGYVVDRVEAYGPSQYVYYRTTDGTVRRAVVSQGTERLTFTNVPADLVRLVLAKLY